MRCARRSRRKAPLLAIVAPKIGGVTTAKGKKLPADQALSGAPSVLFDAVAPLPSEDGAALLANEAAAIDWLRDAFGHLKVIGHVEAAAPLFEKAAIAPDADDGVVALDRKARRRSSPPPSSTASGSASRRLRSPG